ncbi:MAG: RHS repeat-associated core domain-containing protein, partial [Lautropia sp.]|nr:RHS repeat-associated core domain-containing protein [Lautropia sp.]
MTRQEQLELWGRDKRPEASKCSASPAVAPCAALGDVAGMGATNQPAVAEGNPVNPLTGQKYQVDLDAAAMPGQLGLEIKRHYSSALGAVANPVGRGWTFSYDTRLFVTRATIQIIQADGRRLIFRRPDTNEAGARHGATRAASRNEKPESLSLEHPQTPAAICTSDRAEDGEILILPEGGYRWTWPTGRQLDFDRSGHLMMIREPMQEAAASSAPAAAPHAEKAGHLAEGASRGAGVSSAAVTAQRPAVKDARDSGADAAQTGSATKSSNELLVLAKRWAILRIQRDSDGRMLQVTDPADRSMRFGYDHLGHLTHIDHPRGRWHYRVSSTGQLLSVTSPEQAQRIYRYEDPGFPSAITAIEISAPALKKTVRMGTWRYDHQGRVIEYNGPREKLMFSYFPADENGVMRTVVADRNGREKTYRFREHGGEWQTTSIIGQGCEHCTTADRHFRYDDQNRLVGTREQIDLKNSSMARMLRFDRDRFGRIERVWRLHWQNDANNRDAAPQAGKDGLSLLRRYEYADDSSLLPSLVASPSVLPGKEYTVRYVYRRVAGKDRPVQITESGYSHGKRVDRNVSVEYDEQGRLLRIDGPLPGANDRIDFRVIEQGAETEGATRENAKKNARFVMSDGLGREVVAGDDDSWLASSLAWLQDNGRFQLHPGEIRHVAANGVRQKVVVDDFNRITQTESPDAGTETIWHDVADRVVRQTDSLGAEVRIEHDDFGRPLKRVVTAPGGFEEITQYRYDGAHLVEVRHPVATERYAHDAQGRITQREAAIHPAGSGKTQSFVTRYRYDEQGTLPVEVTLPNGAIVRQSVDNGLHDVSLIGLSGDASKKLYQRELRGSLGKDGVREERWRFGNNTQRVLRRGKGERLLSVQDSRAAGLAAHDAGRQEKGAEHTQFPAATQSDDSGVSGDAVSPQDKTAGMPEAPVQWSPLAISGEALRYDDRGKIVALSSPGREQRLVWSKAGYLMIAEEWQPDRESAQESRPIPNDAVERLNGFSRRADWWYAWDENGNRVFTGRNVQVDGRQSNESVFQSGITGSASHYLPGTNRLRDIPHDAAGRPLQWQGWKIEWHPGGQISTITHADGRVLRYFYNHRGERVAREENGQWSFFDYDNGRLQAEVSATHPAMRVWWYEGEIPALMLDASNQDAWATWIEPGAESDKPSFFGKLLGRWFGQRAGAEHSVTWLHVGHHGMPLAATNSQGQVVWQQQYGPFGEKLPGKHAGPENDPRLRFPGQWEDPATGLYYNLLRDYDPTLGRYLSPDPLGLRAGPNPYLYVNGDPVRNIDPTGLLLFAFDGTYNNRESNTNIWKFYQLYQAEGNGAPASASHRAYLEGVGVMGGEHTAYRRADNPSKDQWEAVVADHWRENVEYHVQQFREAVNALKPGEELNIDVVGFSRGASQALEFGRLIARELRSGKMANAAQVNLRFMGLLDPVPTNMYDWDGVNSKKPDANAEDPAFWESEMKYWKTLCNPMGVDDEWDNVVNILAAHDQRDFLFDAGSLGSQLQNRAPGKVREEFALAGSHSDIGGGYEPEDGSDLSDVAFWALLERARDAGINLREPEETGIPADDWRNVTIPVAHVEWTLVDGRMNGREIIRDGAEVHASISGVPGINLRLESIQSNNPAAVLEALDEMHRFTVNTLHAVPESGVWRTHRTPSGAGLGARIPARDPRAGETEQHRPGGNVRGMAPWARIPV